MKKTLLSFSFLGLSILTFGQVGVGTNSPKATLHVVGKPTDVNTADGIIAPIITRTDLIAKNNQYTATQTGAMVYVTDLSGTADTTKAVDVNTIGYYYFDGTKWVKFNPTITISNGITKDATSGDLQLGGTLIKPTTIDQANNTLAFTGTAINAFSVDGTTLSVDAANHSVGIGTSTPNTNAKLDITSTNKGLLLPRVALTALNIASPLTAHVAGMEVYNTAKSISVVGQEVYPGKYINDGTQWVRQMTVNDKQLIVGGTGQDLIITPIAMSVGASTNATADITPEFSFTLTKPNLVDFNSYISVLYENESGGTITDGTIRLTRAYWVFTQKPAAATNITQGASYGAASSQFTSNGVNTVVKGYYFVNPNFTMFLPEGTYKIKIAAVASQVGTPYNVTFGGSTSDGYSIVTTMIK
jgi:hypothetical protein